MPNTRLSGAPFPPLDGTSPPNIPDDMRAINEHFDRFVVLRFLDAAARDAAFATPNPAPVLGQVVHLDAPAPGELQRWNGTAWVRMVDANANVQARGLVGPPQIITANTVDIEAETFIWSPMTRTLFSDRRYEVLVHAHFPIHSVDGIRSSVAVRHAAGTTVALTSTRLMTGKSRAQGHTIHAIGYVTGLAGEHTFGFTLVRELGAAGNTVRINSAASEPSSVAIKDVGPA